MPTNPLDEKAIEYLLLEHLATLSYQCKSSKDLKRKSNKWVLENVFRGAVHRINFNANSKTFCNLNLNTDMQERLLDEALQKLKALENIKLLEANAKCTAYLTRGIPLEVFIEGETRGILLHLIDFENLANNTFVACNQLYFHAQMPKQPDIVLFVNGLPLVVCELKNPLDLNATLESAYQQIQTYKAQIPHLFIPNLLCVLSDGLNSKVGSLSADFMRFMRWRSEDKSLPIEILEVLKPRMLLEILRFFVVYEKQTLNDKRGLVTTQIIKKIAAYHQYYAVQKAIESVKVAMCNDKRGGVVWHTQGRRALQWCFLVQRRLQLLQTRHYLSSQRFRNESKSFELLSMRENIIVLCDEAHRSQYGYESRLVKIGLSVEGREILKELDSKLNTSKEQDKINAKATRVCEIVGAKKRLEVVAKDIVAHFTKRKE